MATTVQVTFDCDDPHAMARSGNVDDGRQFAVASACGDPERERPRLYFQKAPEGKVTKNRVHLDLHLGPERYEAEAARLEALGARKLWFRNDRGAACWTMADIEGNEFCVD
jgi:hypothetical protein